MVWVMVGGGDVGLGAGPTGLVVVADVDAVARRVGDGGPRDSEGAVADDGGDGRGLEGGRRGSDTWKHGTGDLSVAKKELWSG